MDLPKHKPTQKVNSSLSSCSLFSIYQPYKALYLLCTKQKRNYPLTISIMWLVQSCQVRSLKVTYMNVLTMKSCEIVFTNHLQFLPKLNCFNSAKGFPSQNEDTKIFIIFQELVNACGTSCIRGKQYWNSASSEMPKILAPSLKGLWNKFCSFFAQKVPRGLNAWCCIILLSCLIIWIMRICTW